MFSNKLYLLIKSSIFYKYFLHISLNIGSSSNSGSGYSFNSGSGSETSGKGGGSSTSGGGVKSRLKKNRARISGLRLPTEGRHLVSQLLN